MLRSLVVSFLCAVALIGSTGPIIVAAEPQIGTSTSRVAAGNAQTLSIVGQAASGTNTPAIQAKTNRSWANLFGYGRGFYKITLGLLGAIAFMLILPRSRTEARPEPRSHGLAVVTTSILCTVGLAIHAISSDVAAWATPVAIGCGALGVAWLGVAFATRRRPWWPDLLRRGALVTILLSGAVAWTTFGFVHAGQFLQIHEFFHYYMGSKYFPENRYLRIYRCTVVAEHQDGFDVAGRKVRNLETNEGGLSDEILARGTDCLDRFSAERWDAFRQDVGLFRLGQSPRRWRDNFRDKGYNATPFWTSIGSPLANWNWKAQVRSSDRADGTDLSDEQRRAFKARLVVLSLIDPLLYAGAFALVYWAFGLEACALMALLLGVGGPWDFRYTGGAFARIPWFFTATAAVCLVKKGYSGWGGGALVTSAMLRLFPGALFGGVALVAAVRAFRQRTISPAHKRLLLGAVIGLSVLVPVSMTTGGPRIYSEFLDNTKRHASTPLTNHAGVRALFSLDMDKRLAVTGNSRLPDSLAPWREARVETFKNREHYYWICAALLFALLGVAARKMADWERLIASTLLVVTLVDLTSYYWVFMLLWAPLVSRNFRHTVLAIYMAIFTQLPLMVIRQVDLRDLAQSVIVIAFMCTILGLIIFDPERKIDPDLENASTR